LWRNWWNEDWHGKSRDKVHCSYFSNFVVLINQMVEKYMLARDLSVRSMARSRSAELAPVLWEGRWRTNFKDCYYPYTPYSPCLLPLFLQDVMLSLLRTTYRNSNSISVKNII
jgi:hypothetical protein